MEKMQESRFGCRKIIHGLYEMSVKSKRGVSGDAKITVVQEVLYGCKGGLDPPSCSRERRAKKKRTHSTVL